MKTSAMRTLTALAAIWIAAGVVVGVWYAAGCVGQIGDTIDGIAVCVELPVFWFVLWLMLGAVCGFPLYYWLNQRTRDVR